MEQNSTYRQLRISGYEPNVTNNISQIQKLVNENKIEIYNSLYERKWNIFRSKQKRVNASYNALLHLSKDVVIPITSEIIINENREVNYGTYSFRTSETKERDYIINLENLVMDYSNQLNLNVHTFLSYLEVGNEKFDNAVSGTLSGSLDKILEIMSIIKNNPKSIDLELSELVTSKH